MNNVICLIGRLIRDIEEQENGATLMLAIAKNYKNKDGEYEAVFIPVVCKGAIASNTKTYCHKGDLIGIKGSLENEENKLIVVAEKITFLSSSNKGVE